MADTEHIRWGIVGALRKYFGCGQNIAQGETGVPERVQIPVETLRKLLGALSDEDGWIGQTASRILSRSLEKPPELIQHLRSLLNHPVLWVRYRALNVLLHLDYKEADVLETYAQLSKADEAGLKNALNWIEFVVPKQEPPIAILLEELRTNSSLEGKTELIRQFGEVLVRTSEGIDLLADLLQDEVETSYALKEDEDDESLAREFQEIRERRDLKRAVESALSDFEVLPPKIQTILTKQTWSPNAKIRKEAVANLWIRAQLDAELVTRLLALLDDEDADVRGATCKTIRYLFREQSAGFAYERKEIAEKLYAMLTAPKDARQNDIDDFNEEMSNNPDPSGAWGALWAVAATLAPTNPKQRV